MKSRLSECHIPLHVVMMGILPALAVWSQNTREVAFWPDVAVVAAALTAGCIAASLLLFLFFRDQVRAAVVVTVCMLLLFSSKFLCTLFVSAISMSAASRSGLKIFLVVWTVASLATVAFVWRQSRASLRNWSIRLNVLGAAIVGTCLVSTVLNLLLTQPSHTDPDQSEVPSDCVQTEEIRFSQKPDIFFLVFDRYAGRETLQKSFDLDNGPFLDELANLGLTVIEPAYCNYPRTSASMSCTLNMQYLDALCQPAGARLLASHAVGQILIDNGYRYYHLGNWANFLRKSDIAHETFVPSVLPSEFAEVVYGHTVLSRMFPAAIGNCDVVLRQFDRVKQLALAEDAEQSPPKFVYSHFLVPHPPFIFQQDGSRRLVNRSALTTSNYREQLLFTNQLILEMVEQIRRCSPDAVIIVQADEGPKFYPGTENMSREQRIRHRTEILSAIYLPETLKASVPEFISPVNTFRFLFSLISDSEIEMLPHRTFFWPRSDVDGNDSMSGAGLPLEDVTSVLPLPGETSPEGHEHQSRTGRSSARQPFVRALPNGHSAHGPPKSASSRGNQI